MNELKCSLVANTIWFCTKKGMLNFSGLFPDMYPKVFSVLWIGGEKYLCQFEPNDWNVFNVEYTMKICIMQQCIICIIIF